MGKGLMADEARDATFILTGAGTWVGKWAYLAADPVTIQEGKRAIAQAILDNRVKARGPRHPHVNPLAEQPFQFNAIRTSPPKDVSCLEIAVLTIHSHLASPLEVKNTIGDRETRGHYHLGSLHLP